MTGALYPATLADHAPCRSLDEYLAELVDRHARLSAAARRGARIANTRTLEELRDLHSRIRTVEDEIDARGSL
jgi:hypothetical protein